MEPHAFHAQSIHVGDGATFRQGHNTYQAPVTIHQTAAPEAVPDTVWDVPDILSANFVGRERDIAKIQDAFDKPGADAPVRCVVYGMPGLGKTQLALKYADLAFQESRVPYVFWISAASSERLVQGFSRLLDLVAFTGRQALDQNARCVAARSWLEDQASDFSRRWLLILDNANEDTANKLWEMIPRRNENGRVLLTTRTKVVAEKLASSNQKLYTCIGLNPLGISDAARLLIRASETNSVGMDEALTKIAGELVGLVGYLPLAIDQAASLLAVSGMPLSELKGIYRSERIHDVCTSIIRIERKLIYIQALEWENDLSQYEQKSVMATFSFALEELQHGPRGSMELLRILLFLDPEYIPIDLLKDGFKLLSGEAPQTNSSASKKVGDQRGTGFLWRLRHRIIAPKGKAVEEQESKVKDKKEGDAGFGPDVAHVQRLVGNEIDLYKALSYMQKLSILQILRHHNETALRIHDLVHLILRRKILADEIEKKKWYLATISVVFNAYESKDMKGAYVRSRWGEWQRMVPHVMALKAYAWECETAPLPLLKLCTSMFAYMGASGQWNEALPVGEDTLRLYNTFLRAPPYWMLVHVMFNLSLGYELQGLVQEAAQMAEKTMEKLKEIGSHNEALTLRATLHLGDLYWRLDREEDAWRVVAPVADHLMSIERTDNPLIIEAMKILGRFYRVTSKWKEAANLLERVLEAVKKLDGTKSFILPAILHELAAAYMSLGRMQEAQNVFDRALKLSERTLGPDHIATIKITQDVAVLYYELGRKNEAKGLMENVVRMRTRIQGADHPFTDGSKKYLTQWTNE